MIREIIVIISAVLTAIGLADIIGFLTTRFLSHKRDRKNLIIVPIEDNADDAELVLRSVAQRYNWGRWDKDSKIICIYEGHNKETEKICRAVCNYYKFMDFRNSSETEGAFESL